MIMIIFIFLNFVKKLGSFWKIKYYLINCAGIAADVPPAASDNRRLYSKASLFIYDELHFKLARSVLKIASYEFANLKYFKVHSRLTFVNLKMLG